MVIRHLYYLILGIAAISLYSCKPDKPEPLKQLDVTAIPQIVKDFTWFKIGTYWVYEDSATNQLDSIYVFQAFFDTTEYVYQGQPTGKYEELTVKSRSAIDNSEYYHQLRGGVWTPDKHRYVVNYVKWKSSIGILNSAMFFYPLVSSNGFSSVWGGDFAVVDTISQKEINGKIYKNIYVFKNKKDETMDYDSTITWMAKGYGLIKKMSLSKPKSFSLLRSNI